MALTPEGTPYVESSDLVANYPSASLSLANRVDLVGVLPFATSTARATAIPTPTDGQYSYLQDSNQTEFWNGSAWVASGKVLQVVRATDTTQRSTTSTSFVDVTGMSVTITPQKSTSALLIIASFFGQSNVNGVNPAGSFQITDSSNNKIGGEATGSGANFGLYNSTNSGQQFFGTHVNIIGYATPATTSAVTYKLRFRVFSTAQLSVNNSDETGQMYAIEVSA